MKKEQSFGHGNSFDHKIQRSGHTISTPLHRCQHRKVRKEDAKFAKVKKQRAQTSMISLRSLCILSVLCGAICYLVETSY